MYRFGGHDDIKEMTKARRLELHEFLEGRSVLCTICQTQTAKAFLQGSKEIHGGIIGQLKRKTTMEWRCIVPCHHRIFCFSSKGTYLAIITKQSAENRFQDQKASRLCNKWWKMKRQCGYVSIKCNTLMSNIDALITMKL